MDNLRVIDKKIIIDVQSRFFDYDASRHLNNSSYLSYMELARYNIFLHYFKADYRTHFAVLKNVSLNFMRPARMGTDISVSMEIKDIQEMSVLLSFVVFDKHNPEKVFATSDCLQITIDVETQKPALFPEHVMKGMLEHI